MEKATESKEILKDDETLAEKEREVTESSIKKSEKTEIPMKTTTEEDYKDTESVVTEKTSLGGTKDETPAIENLNVKEDTKEVDTKVSQNQWGWNGLKGWGSSVINNAASQVSSAASQVSHFTNQVGDGLMHVLDSGDTRDDEDVEIEIPNKEPIKDQNFSKKQKTPKEGESVKDNIEDDSSKETVALGTVIESNKSPWWISELSNVVNKTTHVLEQTTKTVVHGGLDMLEVVGKKTYNIITEGDHGLKSALKKNKERKTMPNLSQVLSEAREISELKLREEENLLESKKFMYSYWFDEYHGLLELEAFELLCRENELKTRQEYEKLQGDKLNNAKELLGKLNDVYKTANGDEEEEEEDDEDASHDFGQLLMEYAAKLPVALNVQKLLQCHEETTRTLLEYEEGQPEKLVPKELYKEALRCLAQFTSLSIHHYHKLAQLFLRSSSSPPPSPSSSSLPFTNVSPIETAAIIVDFSRVLRKELTIESNKFVSALATLESEKSVKPEGDVAEEKEDGGQGDDYNEQITSVYLEAANSGKFILKSLKLLLPALQLAILNE